MSDAKIIEDRNLVEPGKPFKVRRSWRERLFSPFIRDKTITPMVPIQAVYVLSGSTYIMHPAVAEQLRKLLNERGEQ